MVKFMYGRAIVAAAITALGLFAASARADLVGDFVSIVDVSQGVVPPTPTGSSLTVSNAGGGNVAFKVTNDTGASMVFNVYFDDSTGLLDSATITNGTGVNFGADGSPANVPEFALLTPPFNATSAFAAVPPPSMNGLVSAGDNVTFTYSLTDSHTLADIEAALESGDLRVAIHTPGGDDSRGSSGIVAFGSVIPTPAAAPMGLVLLSGLAMVRARRAR